MRFATSLIVAGLLGLTTLGAAAQGQIPGVIANPGSGPIRNDTGRIPTVRQSPNNPDLYRPAPPPNVQLRIDRREQMWAEREQRRDDRRFRRQEFREIYGENPYRPQGGSQYD